MKIESGKLIKQVALPDDGTPIEAKDGYEFYKSVKLRKKEDEINTVIMIK